MKWFRAKIVFLAFLSATAFGADNVIINPVPDQDTVIKVNDGGVVKDLFRADADIAKVIIDGDFQVTGALTMPEATASVSGIVGTGAQTFAGAKTFNGSVVPTGGFGAGGLATASVPGLVGTGAQTFAGAKTFNGSIVPTGGFGAGGLATASVPGLVGTGTQTFAGAKTFNGTIDAAGGFTGTGGLATSTTAGLVKSNRYQTKTHGPDVKAPASILGFANLTVGKTYLAKFTGFVVNIGASGNLIAHIRHNGVDIKTIQYADIANSSWRLDLESSVVFTATTTTVEINVSSASASLYWGGGRTQMTVIELSNTVVTNAW